MYSFHWIQSATDKLIRPFHKSQGRGFSIPELLLTLLIIAEIATFAIPKVLGAVNDNKRNAVFKETYATIFAVFNQYVLTGQIYEKSTTTYFRDNLNYVKYCAFCSSGCSAGSQDRSNEPGFLLANGAALCGYNAGPWTKNNEGAESDNMSFDWNGAAGPNLDGEDQFRFALRYQPASTGRKILLDPNSAASRTLVESIMK